MLLTVSNLYPRPDQPVRGLFNARFFSELARRHATRNVCLVPEWRPWRWPAVRAWADPRGAELGTGYLPVFYVPLAGRSLSWRTYAWSLARLERLIAGAEAVLVTWLYPDAVVAGAMAVKHGRPYWVKAHGTDRFHLASPARRRRVLKACLAAQGVLVNCRFMAGQIAAAGVPAERIHVVFNGVDAERFRYRAREEALALLPAGARSMCGEPLILFVGNLVRVKGPDIALRALRRAREAFPDARMLVIGRGRLRGALEREAQGPGLAGAVMFAGERSNDEVALWMNVADCLCLASRSEGLPNVVLEAQASGLPVVATDVGEVPELLSGGARGRVIAARGGGVGDRLGAALAEVLRAPADRAALAREGRRRASWGRRAEEALGIMRKHCPGAPRLVSSGA
ncbi:MAG: glycosyltransferase family 4 protein [Lentisphaerae bacterium]|nr:glycosyltransferase family 4 protein [Lentisphaerota bacterium]